MEFVGPEELEESALFREHGVGFANAQSSDGQSGSLCAAQEGTVVARDEHGAIQMQGAGCTSKSCDGLLGISKEGSIEDGGVLPLEETDVGDVLGAYDVDMLECVPDDGSDLFFLLDRTVDGREHGRDHDYVDVLEGLFRCSMHEQWYIPPLRSQSRETRFDWGSRMRFHCHRSASHQRQGSRVPRELGAG